MQKLTIEDISKLRPFLEKANYNEYNSNVVTMMMWQFSYPTSYEIHEHFALVKWHYGNEQAWMMPLCEFKYRKEAMQYMREYSETHNELFVISSVTEEFKSWCQSEYENEYVYENYEDAQDYVYNLEPQLTLSGKKMQKRRNHYNAFIKEYENQFIYKDLYEIDNNEILSLIDSWNVLHDDSESLTSERKGTEFILENRDTLALLGGGIYINNELKAIIIASRLSKDTLEIHVEKAQKDIRGLYIAILKHFLMAQNKEFKFINREDDMGLETLRTAKMNMHPCHKIKKYGIMIRNTNIRKANNEDLEDIKQLWKDSFPEETLKTTEFFFDHLYHKEDFMVLTQDNEIVSMLQRRKMNIMLNDKAEEISFIVGVATKSYFYHNHFMKELLEDTLDELKKNEKLTVLQAYNWDLYKPFGFEVTHYLQKVRLNKNFDLPLTYTFKKSQDAKQLLTIYNTYCKEKNGYRIRDIAYYEQFLLPYIQCENGDAYIVYDQDKQPVGSLILYDNLCSEYLPLNENANLQMQRWLSDLPSEVVIVGETNLAINGERNVVPTLMSLCYDEINLKEPLFINEFL